MLYEVVLLLLDDLIIKYMVLPSLEELSSLKAAFHPFLLKCKVDIQNIYSIFTVFQSPEY